MSLIDPKCSGDRDIPDSHMKILVLQTAFIGDVVLTLPVFQSLKTSFPDALIDGLVIPRAANLLESHDAVHDVIVYDKRKTDRGLRSFLRIASQLRERRYDIVIIPHRSLRSAALAWFARIPRRIGFDRSAGSFLLTDIVRYEKEHHEIDRNTALLEPLGCRPTKRILPVLQPTDVDNLAADRILDQCRTPKKCIALAPGTVWNTKRWPGESFAEVVRHLTVKGYSIVLVGGKEDAALCGEIKKAALSEDVIIAAGELSLRETAALIKKVQLLISNDSAPMHLAVAVGTPVLAIFGATVPAFGFAPVGPRDQVMQVEGLTCRPCSIHGTEQCPIGTFACMERIRPTDVAKQAESMIAAEDR